MTGRGGDAGQQAVGACPPGRVRSWGSADGPAAETGLPVLLELRADVLDDAADARRPAGSLVSHHPDVGRAFRVDVELDETGDDARGVGRREANPHAAAHRLDEDLRVVGAEDREAVLAD